MGGMLDVMRNAWKIYDLRKKILFTVLMLIVYRIGAVIPVPGLDPARFKELVSGGGLFGFLNIISGGAFEKATIFAMNISPILTRRL